MTRVRLGLVALLILAATAACGKSNDPRDRKAIIRELPTAPYQDTPANPASASPCDTIGTADIRSVFGGGSLGTGIINPNNAGECTWVVVTGDPRKFSFAYPVSKSKPQTRTPNAVAVTRAEMAKTPGARAVPGVGDFAFFDPATATLHVAKAPNIAFSVRVTKGTGEPLTDTASLNRLKALGNEYIATRRG